MGKAALQNMRGKVKAGQYKEVAESRQGGLEERPPSALVPLAWSKLSEATAQPGW